ncbi:hypothetical protein ACOSP7_032720 [Xanthoceras sorbifolium]
MALLRCASTSYKKNFLLLQEVVAFMFSSIQFPAVQIGGACFSKFSLLQIAGAVSNPRVWCKILFCSYPFLFFIFSQSSVIPFYKFFLLLLVFTIEIGALYLNVFYKETNSH